MITTLPQQLAIPIILGTLAVNKNVSPALKSQPYQAIMRSASGFTYFCNDDPQLETLSWLSPSKTIALQLSAQQDTGIQLSNKQGEIQFSCGQSLQIHCKQHYQQYSGKNSLLKIIQDARLISQTSSIVSQASKNIKVHAKLSMTFASSQMNHILLNSDKQLEIASEKGIQLRSEQKKIDMQAKRGTVRLLSRQQLDSCSQQGNLIVKNKRASIRLSASGHLTITGKTITFNGKNICLKGQNIVTTFTP